MTVDVGGNHRAIPVASRIAVTAVVLGSVLLSGMSLGASSASAQVSPAPEPPPSGLVTPAPPDEVSPEPVPSPDGQTTVVLDPAGFSPTGTARASGTAVAGSRVVVTVAGAQVCAVTATADGRFDCGSIRLPDGAGIEVIATESLAGSPQRAPASARIDVLRPPVVDGPANLLTTGVVSGTGRPGAAVIVSVDAVPDANCGSVPVAASGYWSCNLARPSGSYQLRAQQSDPAIASGSPSGFSNAQAITIDRDAPAAAVITSPTSGSTIRATQVTVSGTGETGAALDLYLDNVPVCSVVVAEGGWSCEITGLPRGSRSFQAVMRDSAGNYAAPSEVVTIVVALPLRSPTASATPTPTPLPSASPTVPAPSETPENDGSDGGGTGAPNSPNGPDAPDTAEDSWGIPTGFGGTISPLLANAGSSVWLVPAVLAVLFLALIAVPLRMLASALRGRVGLPRLTGRNRATERTSTSAGATGATATVSHSAGAHAARATMPWLFAGGAVAVVAGLILFAGGIAGEVRYLRLYLAVAIGLALLNLIAGLALRVTSRSGRTERTETAPVRLRVLPLMLVAASASALLSRLLSIEPPIVAGVLIGAVFAAGVTPQRRAVSSIVQIGVVMAMGVIGWLLVGVGGIPSGFWPVLLQETLATVCLAGLGSALVLVLPLGSLPGRMILDWSPAAWFGTSLVVVLILGRAVFAGVALGPALLPVVFVAVAFAAVSVAVWAFVRFVEPAGA